MNGIIQVGSMRPSLFFGFHSDSVELATICVVFTTGRSSNHQRLVGSMSQTVNKKIGYGGEKRLFIFNNLHRYFLYAAMIIIVIKWWDVTHTLHFDTGWGFSFGTFIMATEAFLLTMYVTSCHALRHLAGGSLDRWVSGISAFRGRLFKRISVFNRSHGFWFWTSLGFVFLGDLWTIAVAEGHISDMAFVLVG